MVRVTSSFQQLQSCNKYTHKHWITMDTLEKTDERKHRKAVLNNSRTRSENQITSNILRHPKMVKKNMRANKRTYLNTLVVKADEAAHHDNMRAVHYNTKKLSGIFNKPEISIKHQDRTSIVGEKDK